MDNNQDRIENLPQKKDKSKVFEKLFLDYYPMLFQVGFRLSANTAFTKDQIQSFFLELWESDFQNADIQHLSAYLRKAFRRKVVKALQKETQVKNLNLTDFSSKSSPSYEALLIKSQKSDQDRIRLKKALDSLPSKQKQVLNMRFYEGMSYNEIASNTGNSQQTIYNQIHSAVKKLRNFLKK